MLGIFEKSQGIISENARDNHRTCWGTMTLVVEVMLLVGAYNELGRVHFVHFLSVWHSSSKAWLCSDLTKKFVFQANDVGKRCPPES